MEVCITLPKDIRLIVSTYDLDDIVKNLRVPVTIDSVFEKDEDKLPAGCYRSMITLCNPNVDKVS